MRWGVSLGVILAVAAGAAWAQPPAAPSMADRQAAGRALMLPRSGVGGCVFRSVDPKVRGSVLSSYESGVRAVPPELPPAVALVGEKCTGRPYSRSDTALVAATLGAFTRTGVAVYFAAEKAIGQPDLDRAWSAASPEEKAPFLTAAKNFLDPKSPPTSPTPAEATPFARRLHLDGDPRLLSPIQEYYLATALGEAAEAQLAAEGAKPVA
jgi:hypothetical protein